MAVLTLALLGRPQILVDDQPVELKSQKAQALFYYLVMVRQSHSRQSLAGRLWSDLDEAAARRNLRVELLKLRAAVDEHDEYLESSRETIGLNRQSDYRLDVERFEQCLHGHEPTFEELQNAVGLYRGEFLEDFHIRDAPLFEEWVTNERERLSQMARQATLRLVEHYIQQQNYDRGLEWVNLLLKREPWLEEAHQQKMRLLALNGQRSAALAYYEVASRILDDEFGVPPADETNALYDQIESGFFERESSPLAPRLSPLETVQAPRRSPPFQAPAVQLHFVGRHTELQTLQVRLTTGESSIIALVGMAGIGKTTLAAHLAHALRETFADGVLWAYTAETEPLDILGSWAQALGYDFSSLSDVENRAAALRGVLVDKQVLLLLDDVRSAARVRPLLVCGNRGSILLTTRDLDVATALNAHISPLTEMTAQDGEQLLTRILGEERVQPEIPAARQICALLQNLPLAVEIAAQRLRSRPRRRLADMAARLHDTQERLDLAISDRAVRTSFLVSWESLDGEQRRIFALLGLFGGRSFAAPALAYIAEIDLYTAEDRLFTLTALSLLTEEENEDETILRYRQHPLLADFAGEQLGDDRAMALRLVQFYLHFAQEQRSNYATLQPEWENLMMALQTAHGLGEWQTVLYYADALTEPWFTRARYTEARAAYVLVKDAAEAVDHAKATMECLLRWGQACIEQYDYDEAKQYLEQALPVLQEATDQNISAQIHYELARIALEQGQYEQAEQLLQVSHDIFTERAHASGLFTTASQQALLAYRRGDFDKAKHVCLRILALEEESNRALVLPVLRLLADIALEEETFDLAERYCQEALALCETLSIRSELAAVYYSLTVLARCQNKLEDARVWAQKAIQQCELTGNRGFKALALHELSRIFTSANQVSLAVSSSEESKNLLVDIRDNFNLVYILRQLGEAQLAAGDQNQARKTWQAALTLAEAQEHPLTQHLRLKAGP